MIIQVFFKFNDFSMHGTFFSDFPGFPRFPELAGTLLLGLGLSVKGHILSQFNRKWCYHIGVNLFCKYMYSAI